MPRELRVHFLPQLFNPDELRGGIAVVIDVLRASTTIIHALAAGAAALVPCAEVDEARRIAANLPAGSTLLGGEREGMRIDGFDLDNSPLNYSADAVSGKTIVYTTTNGTRALLLSSEADRVLIGAMSNLEAVAGHLASETRPIHLVCAGTDCRVSSEDVLCAGAVAARLSESVDGRFVPDDQTDIAVAYFSANADDDRSMLDAIRASRGGRNLQQLGLELEIDRCATTDLYSLIPEYVPRLNRIETM